MNRLINKQPTWLKEELADRARWIHRNEFPSRFIGVRTLTNSIVVHANALHSAYLSIPRSPTTRLELPIAVSKVNFLPLDHHFT